MSTKKIALELLVKLKLGDITLEELNNDLALVKKEMSEIGDEGSEDFKQAAKAVEELETHIGTVTNALKETKEGFDKTADAQKKAATGSGTFSKGLKAVGTAFKAMGIGLVVAALKFLFDALSQNQKVMDAVTVVTETISIVFSKVVDTVMDVVSSVSESSKGFEGLTKVVMGLLTLAITPLKLSFYAIKLAMQSAQLAWEQSFFGDGDPETIKELRASISETKDDLIEVGKDAIKAGIDIGDNLGKAANEIGGVVSGVVKGVSEISVKGAIAQAKSIKDVENAAKIAAAQQGLLLEQYDRLAEKQRQIRDDDRVGIQDRIKANNDLNEILKDQEKAMLAQANLQIAAAQAQVNKNRNVENETALIEALANKAGVLAAVEGFRSEQKANEAALDRERIALTSTMSQSEADLAYERKKFNAEQIEDKLKSLEALRDLEDERQQEEMLRLEGVVEATNAGTQAEVDALILLDEFREASRQANISANKAIIEETLAQNKILTDKQKENDEKKKENDEKDLEKARAIQKAKFDIASSTLTALSNLVTAFAKGDEENQKKAFKLNKAIGIGQAIISTAQAVTGALSEPSLIPGARFVKAGIAAAVGAAQIATIAKTQFGGSGSVSTNIPSGDVGSNVGSQPRAFTSPRVDTNQQTTKVIVTETDIRSVTGNVSGIYNRAVVVE